MDELTRERFLAKRTRPPRQYEPEEVYAERRIVLCGTADPSVKAESERAGRLRAQRMDRDRKLVRAIRRQP